MYGRLRINAVAVWAAAEAAAVAGTAAACAAWAAIVGTSPEGPGQVEQRRYNR
jgi:hypothetical protein